MTRTTVTLAKPLTREMAIATTEPNGATRYCRVIVWASASVTSSRRSRRPFTQYRHTAFHAMAMNRKLPEYTTAAVPASGSTMWAATIEVVKGVRTTKRRRIPFLSMRRRSTRSMWLNMLWWLSHMTRIVMKLVTMAKKNGASLISPSDNDVVSVDGSRRFRTSNVMAKAKTPSLKASVLAVSFAPRLSLISMGRVRRHASGRFEGAAGRSDGV